MIRLLALICTLLLPFIGVSQILENYKANWVDQSDVAFWERMEQRDVIVDLHSFPESHFQFEVPKGSTIFIDGKLWRLFPSDTAFTISSRQISDEFGSDSVKISVIGPRNSFGSYPLTLSKVAQVGFSKGVELAKVDQVIKTRFLPQPVKDFYFTSLSITLFLFAIYKIAYPYLLGVLLQPLAVINAEDFSESGSLQKVFSFDILFYLFIVSTMMAQCLVTGMIIFKKEWIEGLIGWDYPSIMLLWVTSSFTILILTILKFIGIRVISYLFDMGKSDFAHFFYLLRLIVFGFTVVILMSLFFVINDFSSLQIVFEILIQTFFWFYIIGVTALFMIMMNRLSFKKYHLFTYLCIAEIVPFLILSKWIMVLVQ